MKTSNKIINKKSNDPIDRLIFEKGLRVKHLLIDSDLDLIIILLNNGAIIKSKISDYPRLKKATKPQLNNWRLISKGISVEWEDIEEDLSVKGFIKNAMLNATLNTLEGKKALAFE